MDTKQLALYIGALTILVNLVLSFSGFTSTVSCTVTGVLEKAYAATFDMVE